MLWLRENVIPVLVTLVLHALLLFFLAAGFSSEPPQHKIKETKFIKANLVQLKTQSKPKPAPAPVKKPAPKPAAKPKVDEKKLALEKQRQQQAALKRQQEKAEQEQREQERREKAQQEKQRQEAERQAQLEKQRRAQELLETLEAEEAQAESQTDEATAMSYMAVIQSAIQSNWSRPPSARNGMEVLLDIQLVPTGKVVSVTIAKSSGNEAFDRSAIAAVDKTESFPELMELESRIFGRYYRHFRLLFKPEDLRL